MKNITKSEEKKLTAIAEGCIPSLEGRGDLKQRFSDEQDFFETSVWSLEEALKAAYELGKQSK